MSSTTEEEAVVTDDAVDEQSSSGGSSPGSCWTPPSQSSPQMRRPPSSTSSDASSLIPDPVRKKTRDLPNICNCHSCGLRFPDRGRNERLQRLDSQWRIVLLCGACLRAIRSAEVCSYCFASVGEEEEGAMSCRGCSARVHRDCLPKQRGFLTASDLDPDSFVCIDCCAFPTPPIKKPRNFGDSCAPKVSSISLEDVVRDAKCAAAKKLELAARAKEKAEAKAVAAKCAAELARNALDLVVVAEKTPLACTQATNTDEKLALQLHLAMNGSQRISKSPCPDNSDCSIDNKRRRLGTDLLCKGSEPGSSNIYGKVELCTEDTLSENMGIIDAKLLNGFGSSEENHHVHMGTREGMDQNKETNKNGEGNPGDIPQLEEQGSCSDTLAAHSTRDDNSVDSVSAACPSSCGANISFPTVQHDEKSNMPDRYLKKYCKRPSRMKEKNENGGSASLLVPVSQ